jgi:hypothetical protein
VELHSRRTFLTRGSVGAAALGAAAALAPGLGSASGSEASGPTHAGPFAAWVKDAKTGEVAVMVGSETVIHQDKKLANQLARIAARAPKP